MSKIKAAAIQMKCSTNPKESLSHAEEMVREAAKQVDIRLNAYREHYQNVTPEKIIAMVAYQFALENLKMKNRNDTRPYADKIEELTEVLETYFKGL